MVGFEDAEQANDTVYDLAAYFYASNLKRVERASITLVAVLNVVFAAGLLGQIAAIVCRRARGLMAVQRRSGPYGRAFAFQSLQVCRGCRSCAVCLTDCGAADSRR